MHCARPLGLAASALILALAPAQAAVLTFDAGPLTTPALCTADSAGTTAAVACSNAGWIGQDYGDEPGRIDVRYHAPRLAGSRSLRWWGSGYNDLWGVLWADTDGLGAMARIDLVPLQAGLGVRLQGFDLGAFSNTTLGTHVEVRELSTDTLLWSYDGLVGQRTPSDATSFAMDLWSARGLRLQWRDDAFNVGLDNLAFDLEAAPVNGVPEPSGLAALAAMAALGVTRRRRRRQA